MTKAELIKDVAKSTKISKKDVAAVIDTAVQNIVKTVAKGKTVNLKGFGQFYTIKRQARKGRNPSTGKPMDIAETTLTKFKAGRSFKAVVKGKAPAEKAPKAPKVEKVAEKVAEKK